jgi:hypothetical protein
MLVCALQLQVRWTLPRFRYDQVMRLMWQNILPLALANIFVTALLVYADASLEVLLGLGALTTAAGAGVVLMGPRRPAARALGAPR